MVGGQGNQAPESGRPVAPAGGRLALVWGAALAVGLATALVFSPAVGNGFVNWDDDKNITNNAAFRGLDAAHLRWMFTTFHGGHYQPLTWLSYAVDYAVGGGIDPRAFHTSSVLLHAVAGVLLFFVALRLLQAAFRQTGAAPDRALVGCAALAAGLFAIHPLRVESVAWVTERRDVLSGVLLFASVLAYLRAVGGDRIRVQWYLAALGLYAVSLLSKAAGMTLPVVLLILDFYPLGRTERGARAGRLVAEKLPFLAFGLTAAAVAAIAQRSAGAMSNLAEIDLLARVAIAGYGSVFYVGKWLAPLTLSPLYAIPPRSELLGIRFVMAAAVLSVAVVAAWVMRRKYPAGFAVLAAYLVLLAPVSGLVQSGRQLAADRYTYLSLAPLALAVGGALLMVHRRRRGPGDRTAQAFSALAAAYMVGLALLTLHQATIWRDSVSLWDWAVRADRGNGLAQVNLADALRAAGMPEAAVPHYAEGLRIMPNDAIARNGLGVTLLRLGQPAPALEQFQKAIDLTPGNAEYRCNLGYVLAGFGRLEEAAQQYRLALGSAPGMTRATEQLADILAARGAYAEAKSVLEKGLDQAAAGDGLRGQLAWLLATCPDAAVRDGTRAVRLAEGLCQVLGPGDYAAADTLAAAYAETGDFERAVAEGQVALTGAQRAGDTELAARIEQRLALYASGQPFRESRAGG